MSESENSESEEYDSDNDDEEYIPEGSGSEDDEDYGRKRVGRKRRSTRNSRGTTKRTRRGGIKLDDEEEEEEEDDDEDEDEEELVLSDDHESDKEVPSEDEEDEEVADDDDGGEDEANEEGEERAEKKDKGGDSSKSRVDNLWAEFKKDTAVLPQTKKETGDTKDPTSELSTKETAPAPKEQPKKVVTEVYDFAGEEVKVVKNVDATSAHAATEKATEIKEDSSKIKEDSSKANPVAAIKKKPSGLGNVLGTLGKKPKLSTLEKSKLDWNQFKEDEGIEDELRSTNQDGYLEKQAFLNRVDQKQFEIERDIRQAKRKK